MNSSDVRIGDRIRFRREELGKSLRAVAGLAGMSAATLSRIENGTGPCDSRFRIADLASALKCDVSYLTGTAVPGGREGAETTAATHDTIAALIRADLDFDPEGIGQPAPIGALAAAVDDAIVLRQQCDYAALTRRLPQLIDNIYAATATDDAAQALPMLVRVAEAASFAVRYTGQPTGATIAAERALQAAKLSGDPLMYGFAEWARAHAALGCGLNARAARIAGAAVDRLTAAGDVTGGLTIRGMLLLTTAFGYVGSGRPGDADVLLDEAQALADVTGETDTLALMFGPTNVKLWRMAITLNAGDPATAMHIAEGANPLLIPSASRQATFFIDQASCMARLGDVDRAVAALTVAERIARQRVQGDPLVRETVRYMLDSTRRRAEGPALRGLAQRVGATV